MRQGNNVIENGNVSITSNNNSIDNDVKSKKYEQAKKVEILADELLRKMNADQGSRDFMCRVAWRLSEAKIWNNVEQAQKGTNPMGLFIFLCKRDGV